MKSALIIIASSIVVWGFWMSWEWLRNRDKNNTENKSNKN
jgi:hypothetical protein